MNRKTVTITLPVAEFIDLKTQAARAEFRLGLALLLFAILIVQTLGVWAYR